MYVCCTFGSMAGWKANLRRSVRSCSASSFHSGARVPGGRGMLVRPVVNCSRVAVWGSMILGLKMSVGLEVRGRVFPAVVVG